MIDDEEKIDAREDLGYEKCAGKKKSKSVNPYEHYRSPKYYERESEEMISARRQRNLLELEDLKKISEEVRENGPSVQLRVLGFWYDFYPATNTWHSHSENRYGCGIEALKVLIQEKIKPEHDSLT